MTFDYPGYDFKFIQNELCNDGSAHKFTRIYKFFSPVTKFHYIIRADYHEHHMFAVKFYCKKDRKSKYKYNKIVNKGDFGKLLITCIKVIPEILSLYPEASFGFIGARTLDASSKKVEGYEMTQRYRVYREIIARKFGQITFEHHVYDNISGYLLLNRKAENMAGTKVQIETMLFNTYNDLISI